MTPTFPTRRALLLAVAGGCMAPLLRAQPAVPYYTSAHAIGGLYRFWYLPAAEHFERQAAALGEFASQQCDAAPTDPEAWRERWATAVLAWDRLSTVSLGPLVTRRTQRRIDFAPVRPESIRRAIAAGPADLQALERVGATAKGFGALEWWMSPGARLQEPQACRYAALLAQDIHAEAQALAGEFKALARKDWSADPAAASSAMAEWVNQWIGGLERLRWQQLERPVRSAGQQAPAFARGTLAAGSWSARMQALDEQTRAGGTAAAPGEGLVPLENYLRGRGLNPLADALATQAAQSQAALQSARPDRSASVLAAARAIGQLKQLGQAQVAPALEIQIGFSDSDGD